jgi:hypothetical protein
VAKVCIAEHSGARGFAGQHRRRTRPGGFFSAVISVKKAEERKPRRAASGKTPRPGHASARFRQGRTGGAKHRRCFTREENAAERPTGEILPCVSPSLATTPERHDNQGSGDGRTQEPRLRRQRQHAKHGASAGGAALSERPGLPRPAKAACGRSRGVCRPRLFQANAGREHTRPTTRRNPPSRRGTPSTHNPRRRGVWPPQGAATRGQTQEPGTGDGQPRHQAAATAPANDQAEEERPTSQHGTRQRRQLRRTTRRKRNAPLRSTAPGSGDSSAPQAGASRASR